MITLLIIADDFTGALDTGVKFADCGAIVRIAVDCQCDFEKLNPGVQVLVMDAETRHMNGQEAYKRVYGIVRQARKNGIPYIYKKTDSALRGNIGSELAGMLDACGCSVLHFLPAFPKMGRTTVGGVQYIEGVPVHESVFGQDPYEPVTCSEISGIIAQQSGVPVRVVTDKTIVTEVSEPTIAVYDAKTDEELAELAAKLAKAEQLMAMAGCAGLAETLTQLLKLRGTTRRPFRYTSKFVVACGSVNPITQRQLDYAEQNGFKRIRLTPEQKLEIGYFETATGRTAFKELERQLEDEPLCIMDTNDEAGKTDTLQYAVSHGIGTEDMRTRITGTVGYLLKELLGRGMESTILITGGDTLLGFMNQMKVYEMVPVGEIAPGIVLSQFESGGKSCEVISKSGGFGKEDLLVKVADEIIVADKERVLC